MSREFGEQVSAVSTGVLDWVFMSAWVRAEELQTNPLREDEEGSAGIRVHFHKSQTRSDLNQRVLGPTVDGREIRGDPLIVDPLGTKFHLHPDDKSEPFGSFRLVWY